MSEYIPPVQPKNNYQSGEWRNRNVKVPVEPYIAESYIRQLIKFVGDDPVREGLSGTPGRVIASYKELFSGYGKNVSELIVTFDSDADQMIVCKDIEMYSTCEHHMLPFYGVAHIAYIPNGKVIGLSKLPRVLEVFSRRLQIQERIGEEVTNTLMSHLAPKGVGCMIEAKHLCVACRGVQKQHSTMITSSLKGVFLEPGVKQEFLTLVKG